MPDVRNAARFLILMLSGLLLVACGGGGGGGSDGTGPAEVSGNLRSPDGSTPIANATVFVVSTSGGNALTRKSQIIAHAEEVWLAAADTCSQPDEVFDLYTCTDASGNFTLDLGDLVGKNLRLTAVKGNFRVSAELDPDDDSFVLENLALSDDPQNGGPKIAVVTGAFDRMQDILAKLGMGDVDADSHQLVLGSEKFDLYDGDGSLVTTDYPLFSDLFADSDASGEADIYDYDTVFINCGTGFEGDFLGASAMAPQEAVIRDYVAKGGVLYVTDLSYDFVEQVFPEYIDFLDDDATPEDEAEQMNVAEQGNDGITTNADVLDSALATWLDGVNCNGSDCRDEDGKVMIAGFLPGWAVMNGKHLGKSGDVVEWVRGPVEWATGSGTKPLTVSLYVGEGEVIYSSYHTEEESPIAGFHPQERILQYLIFEAGAR